MIKNNFQNSIRNKIYLGSLIIFLLIIIEGGITIILSHRTQKFLDPMLIERATLTLELKSKTQELSYLIGEYANTGEMYQLNEIRSIQDSLDQLFSKIFNSLKGNYQSDKKIKSIRKKLTKYIDNALKLADDHLNSQPLDNNLAITIEGSYKSFREEIENEIIEEHNVLLNIFKNAEKNSSQNIKIIIFGTLLVIASSFLLISILIRKIILPIAQLDSATKSFGQGNLDVTVNLTSNDEFQALGESFNFMVKNLKEKTTHLENAKIELSQLLDERMAMENKIREANKELKQTNQELKKSNQLKSEFLANMSHELRTPLNAIINFTDQIIEDWEELKTDEEWNRDAHDMSKRTLRSGKHLLSLINDLLDIAKIEAGQTTLQIEEFDLSRLMDDTMAEISPLATKKGIALENQFTGNLPPFNLDQRMIKQVFLNLLSNAIKFTDRGKVSVQVRQNDAKNYLIDITDTGIGLPEEKIQQIFDRFRQLDNSDSRKYQGTGLGLNLVREILRIHGGKISVKSIFGKGSTFTVTLPLFATLPEDIKVAKYEE